MKTPIQRMADYYRRCAKYKLEDTHIYGGHWSFGWVDDHTLGGLIVERQGQNRRGRRHAIEAARFAFQRDLLLFRPNGTMPRDARWRRIQNRYEFEYLAPYRGFRFASFRNGFARFCKLEEGAE
jgi:hypothetical protein